MEKKKSENRKKMEVEMTLKGAALIKDSILIVTKLQQMVGMEPCDVLTSALIAFGDLILSYADAADEPREKVLKMCVGCLKDHVRTAESPTVKEGS